MAYYFTIQKKKGEYTPIDITKSKYFTRVSKFKGMGMSLEETDLYTMMFNNEKELRIALLNEGLLNMNDYNLPLTIRSLRNGKYTKVMYDFLYQKDIETIMNPELLIQRIENKLDSGDFRFVSNFANNYLKFHECLSTAPEVREFAMQSIRDGKRSNYFNKLDENNDNPLVRMTKLLIYKYYQNHNGKIVYTDKIIYRNLHSLLAFTNYYDKKYQDEVDENQTSLFEVEPKKKTRKKIKQIPGQTSLFDEENKD